MDANRPDVGTSRFDARTAWVSGASTHKQRRKALAHAYAEERHALPNARETFAAIKILKEMRAEEVQAKADAILASIFEPPAAI